MQQYLTKLVVQQNVFTPIKKPTSMRWVLTVLK